MNLLGVALRLTCALLVVTIPVEAAERGPRSISLPQALQRALAANPRLTAAERDVGIAGGLKIQAGVLPNPEASFELDKALGSGPYRGLRSAETNLQLSQLVELGGKRQARLAAGEAGIGTAVWQRRATRLEASKSLMTKLSASINSFPFCKSASRKGLPLLRKHCGRRWRPTCSASIASAPRHNWPRRAATLLS